METVRIIGADPGKHNDSFAIVLIGIDVEKGIIYIKGAKQWLHQAYQAVEKEIAKISSEKGINYIAVEVNMNESVAEALRYTYNLPVRFIRTTANITNPKPDLMDKTDMVYWLIRMHQEGRLQWAESTSEYMKELKRQWSIFGEYKQNKFEAPTGEHDDLVMALMLACFIARQHIRSGGLVMVNAHRLGSSIQERVDKLNKDYEEGTTGIQFEVK